MIGRRTRGDDGAGLLSRAAWRSHDLGPREVLRLKQAEIGVHQAGAGPPIVLVHGAGVNANLWRKVVPRLAPSFRCITLDLPFGAHSLPMPLDADLSPPALANMIADALEALELDSVTLIGNDNGGAYCQLLITRRPERVARLVLTSSDALECFPARKLRPLLPVIPALSRIAPILAPALRRAGVRRRIIKLIRVTKRPIEHEALDSYVLPMVVDQDIRRDVVRFAAGFDRRHTLDAAKRMHRFEKPALIAWSRDDHFFPAALAERLAAALPDARIEWIEDSRLFSPEDQPDQLARAVTAFIEGSPAVA